MDTKKTVMWFLVLSIVGFGLGCALSNSYELKFCLADFETNTFDVGCHELLEGLGNPLFYGMGALALVFFVLLFAQKAWGAWRAFAIWFVPLATLLFIFYPEPGSGDYFSPYPETVFKWVSGVYVIISLVIIGFASLKKDRN